MSAVSSTPNPSVKPTVVLACASEDAIAMAKVLRRLVERGVRVDVVAGVDDDVRPFQAALARGTTRTVYVICRSDDLDAFQVDRLRTAAQNAKVTSDRLVLVPFDPELPIDFAETVLRQLAENGRMLRRATRELPPVPTVGPQRAKGPELALVPTGSSLRRSTALFGKPAETKPALPAGKPLAKLKTVKLAVPTVKPTAPTVNEPAAQPTAPAVKLLEAIKPMPARVISAPVVGAPKVSPPALANTTATAIPNRMATDESFFRLVVEAAPANESTGAMELDDDFDDAITNVITLQADSMRLMSGVATPMAGPTVPVEAPAPPPPAIVETAVGIVDLCPDPAAVTKPDWPQVPIAAAPPVQSEPSTASLVLSDGLEDAFAPSRRGARRLGVALAIAAGVLATIVGVSRSVDEAPPASAHSWAATAGPLAVTRIDPRAAADGTANAATASTPTVPTPAVIAALEGRKIRAFDGLFVATAKAAPMRRGAATSHCRNLAIAGLVHWRLPSADEIALLGDAGFVPADSTWWQGGKKIRKPRVEWTGKRVRTQAAKKTAAARTLCVHAVEL